jgi:Yqey-like protein
VYIAAERASPGAMQEAIAVLRDDINSALKQAMKARQERRTATLRLVNAAMQNADIEAQMQGKPPVSDDELRALLQKMIKQRQEAADMRAQAARRWPSANAMKSKSFGPIFHNPFLQRNSTQSFRRS